MSLLDKYDLVIAFDTEFVSDVSLAAGGEKVPKTRQKPKKSARGKRGGLAPEGSEDSEDEKLHVENFVVSYQIAVLHPASGEVFEGMYRTGGLGRQHRHRLTTLITRAVAGLLLKGIDIHAGWKARLHADMADHPRRKVTKPKNLSILLAGHYTRADLPSCADFKSLRKSFDSVRGTYVSIQRPTIRDITMPNGARVKATLTLLDTRLLAPAGAGKLRDLGDLIGLEKLEVPPVIDKMGATVPGITRMDLVAVQHPAEFDAYAKRDAIVSLRYLMRVAEFAESWGLKKMPPTIASIATTRLRNDAGHLLPGILGREMTKGGRIGDPIPEVAAFQSFAADSYHGGHNQAFVHGVFTATPERPFNDCDIKGCYTTSMSNFREMDFAARERTTDPKRLAVLEDPAIAVVDFKFPDGTRFPCLPIPLDGGLAYPLEGTTTVTGPELLLALNLGADIRVREGLRVPWLEPDMDRAERPLMDFAQLINKERRDRGKGSLLEKLAKESGNSIYGRLGQGVSGMKRKPDNIRKFDTRSGDRHSLPPSVITSPLLAAMTSGLPRAVLGEILSRLPAHVRVLSATTDGWISDANAQEIEYAIQGPICRWFSKLRATVDPDGSNTILEIKHQALSVLVARTRHSVTIEPFNGSDYMLARAGHRLTDDWGTFEFDKGDKAGEQRAMAAECAAFLKLQREREADTTLMVSSFISLSKQWEDVSDLLVEHTLKKVALCFDMKRRPVDPIDFDGMIQFQTVPWQTLEEYKEARDDLDRWRTNTISVLKTVEDWKSFEAWRPTHRRRTYAHRTPFENAVVVAWAQGLAGFSIRNNAGRCARSESLPPTKSDVAALLTALEVPGVTIKTLDNARQFEADPTGSVTLMHDEDWQLLVELEAYTTAENLSELLAGEALKNYLNKTRNPGMVLLLKVSPQSFLAEEKPVKPLDIVEEIDKSKVILKESPRSGLGERERRRFFCAGDADEKCSVCAPPQVATCPALRQLMDGPSADASVVEVGVATSVPVGQSGLHHTPARNLSLLATLTHTPLARVRQLLSPGVSGGAAHVDDRHGGVQHGAIGIASVDVDGPGVERLPAYLEAPGAFVDEGLAFEEPARNALVTLRGTKRNVMALDDWQHGRRIKAELRRQYGVGDVSFRIGQKRAAKIAGLTDREHVLLGYVFALMSKTKKSEAECRRILQSIVVETV